MKNCIGNKGEGWLGARSPSGMPFCMVAVRRGAHVKLDKEQVQWFTVNYDISHWHL